MISTGIRQPETKSSTFLVELTRSLPSLSDPPQPSHRHFQLLWLKRRTHDEVVLVVDLVLTHENSVVGAESSSSQVSTGSAMNRSFRRRAALEPEMFEEELDVVV